MELEAPLLGRTSQFLIQSSKLRPCTARRKRTVLGLSISVSLVTFALQTEISSEAQPWFLIMFGNIAGQGLLPWSPSSAWGKMCASAAWVELWLVIKPPLRVAVPSMREFATSPGSVVVSHVLSPDSPLAQLQILEQAIQQQKHAWQWSGTPRLLQNLKDVPQHRPSLWCRACVEWAETATPWVEDMMLPHIRFSSCT